jgi:hypothetical protein
MIECVISIHLPLQDYPDVEIARYSFDPGLRVGDIVNIRNLEWDLITQFQVKEGIYILEFEAMVTIRKYLIDYDRKNTFLIDIGLEMADKEHLSRLVEIIKHNSSQDY